jgi:predicted O-methyltransferase YrrM
VGGVIVADNVLRDGKVLHLDDADENTIALDEYNQKIQADARVANVLFAVRDGLMIARKERE